MEVRERSEEIKCVKETKRRINQMTKKKRVGDNGYLNDSRSQELM